MKGIIIIFKTLFKLWGMPRCLQWHAVYPEFHCLDIHRERGREERKGMERGGGGEAALCSEARGKGTRKWSEVVRT